MIRLPHSGAHVGLAVVACLSIMMAGASVSAEQKASAIELPDDALGNVLGGEVADHPADRMMQQYLHQRVMMHTQKHHQQMLQQNDPEAIRDWQQQIRRWFEQALGSFPEQNTPLNATITGQIQRENFRVEKVLFESQPGFHVTAALFMPDDPSYEPPYPGVVITCGHAQSAKGSKTYQSIAALLASHGVAALMIDPVDQGERHQLLDNDGESLTWGTDAHNRLGMGSSLLGISTATFMVHDVVRALDYLESRPDINAERLGVSGNSGGGTQTALVMGLDERIKAAVPVCYITSYASHVYLRGEIAKDQQQRSGGTRVGDMEQIIPGQIEAGLDYWGYLSMRAPDVAVLVGAARDDFFPIDGVFESMEVAEHVYEQFEASDRIGLTVAEGRHGWHKPLREATAEWFVRWLRDEDREIVEPDDWVDQMLTLDEIQVTPTGEVVQLPDARSAYDINRDRMERLREEREASWRVADDDELRRKIRQVTGIRQLTEIPQPTVEEVDVFEAQDYRLERYRLEPEPGIALPVVAIFPTGASDAAPVLWMHSDGMASDESITRIEQYLAAGHSIVAVDLRGIGETRTNTMRWYRPYLAHEGKSAAVAYLLGRPFISMRAEDILNTARFAHSLMEAEGGLVLAAEGAHVGMPALHAAALEPSLFVEIDLADVPESYEPIVTEPMGELMQAYPMDHLVHGALEVYDLPQLRELVH